MATTAWASRRGRVSRVALAALGGVGLGLGHSPYGLPWLAFAALPLLFHLWAAAPGRAGAALTGWAAGVGFFGLTLSWIVEPFLVDIARHGVLAIPALLGMAGGLALFWGAAFWLARAAAPEARGLRAVLALAAALTGAEYLRSVVLTGFPWALPAYAWTDTPVAQAAAWAGPHGLGLLLLLLALLPALLRPLPLLAAAAGLALLWGAGAWRLDRPDPAAPGPVLRLVQPNAAQRLKWQPEMIPRFYQRLLTETAAPAGTAPDAVIWPETAVPWLVQEEPGVAAQIAAAAGPGTPVLLGALERGADGGWYNGLTALGDGGAVLGSYRKHHLVPFGEYMPLAGALRAVGLLWIAEGLAGSFDRGPGPRLMAVPGLPPFQPLICYEAIFPHQILRGAQRPAWLLQVTNDAWFGTWSGPYQHLDQARMRAIEQGLPLARAANTGVSAVIDARGRVLASLPLGVPGRLDAALPGALEPTLYARTGDRAALIALLALLTGAALWPRRRRAA
ncbi:apolipoprotein N-acyltransferase [Rhodobacteraceae bacterium 2CG4]|uniref:Apolipoprotein N-acyltransferase n=1 Tax=Halovulum marinum TaxID=2662447 RepID=A0A6L5Z6X7_9RHOB|nr:apolipoprotein N-acyltransferase [Halovulum marinum]